MSTQTKDAAKIKIITLPAYEAVVSVVPDTYSTENKESTVTWEEVTTPSESAPWLPATLNTSEGRITGRVVVPSAGRGLAQNDSGVIDVATDETLEIDAAGRLTVVNKSHAVPQYLTSGSSVIADIPESATALNFTTESRSGAVMHGNQVVVSKCNWVRADVTVDIKPEAPEENIWIIPVTVNIGGLSRTFQVDTTAPETSLSHHVVLDGSNGVTFGVTVNSSREDASERAVRLKTAYKLSVVAV